MKKTIFFILMIIACIFCVKNAKSQSFPGNIEYIGENDFQFPPKAIYHSWDGRSLSPFSTIRCLNIFVNIIYDQAPATDIYNGVSTPYWEHDFVESVNNDVPTYLLDFADIDYSGPNNVHGFQTRLMYESSFGNFIVLGDFIVVNIKQHSPGGI